MKVFLVERGGPFFSRRADAGSQILEKERSPLLILEKAASLPSFSSEWYRSHDACVLPGELLLETPELPGRIPVIAYGGAEMAFSCFEAGAADFMREGWTRLELEARLYRYWQPSLACEEGLLSLRGNRLAWEGREAGSRTFIELSPGEAMILRRLFAVPGRVAIAESPRGSAPLGTNASRALSMRMSRLKSKLSILHPGLGDRLRSKRGEGYLWISR
jgi:hypothetical protein